MLAMNKLRLLGGLCGWALIALAACSVEPASETQDTTTSTSTSVGGGEPDPNCETGTLCDGSCVDVDNDPNNCGACGRTCVVSQAEASCDAGECVLNSCQQGFADCDSQLANGCEAEVDCEQGKACTTSCDSQGTLSCADACAPSCDLPAESCNLIDDNCDGSCDEGAVGGCRIGVHRSIGPLGHYYTTDESDALNQGQTIEALDYFHLYNDAAGDLRPLFRCLKSNGKTFLTTSTNCDMIGNSPTTVGFIAPMQECGAIPLYQLHLAASNAHFYTTSAAERDNAVNNLGYVAQREVGYVWGEP
jgi:hypothetical protein